MFLAPTIVFNLYFLGASDGIIDSRTINSLMTCMQRFNQNTSLVIKSLQNKRRLMQLIEVSSSKPNF